MGTSTVSFERLGVGVLIAAVLFVAAAACGPIPVPVLHSVVLWSGAVAGGVLLAATIGWIVRLNWEPEPLEEVLAAASVIFVLAAGFGAYAIRFWSTPVETIAVARQIAAGEGAVETLDARVVRLIKAGNYAEAETLGKQAIEENTRKHGPDHPATAMSLKNLAAVYRRQAKYGDAEPLQKRAVEIDEKALGPEHADTADSLNGLALLYAEQGRYADAEPLYKQALAIREKVLGADHPDTVTCREDLGAMQAERDAKKGAT